MTHATKLGALALLTLALAGCGSPEPNTSSPQTTGETNTTGANNTTGTNNTTGIADMGAADMSGQPDMPAEDMATSDALTYHKDIAPILHQRCNGCHVEGGIGPFALGTYAQVKPLTSVLVDAVQTRRMPPWPPEQDCGEFQNPRIMPADEIAKLTEWVQEGAIEGDPATAAPLPERPGQLDLGEVDMTIKIPIAYKPSPPENSVDDYHCFVIDPKEVGLVGEKFVNAFRTRPGNPSIVHHVLLYTVPRSAQGRIDTLSAQTPDSPGYTCFGTTRVSGEELLAGWVPGMTELKFPNRHGIPISEDKLLVLQMHYNTVNDREGSDQTEMDLFFVKDDGAQPRKLAMVPIADLDLRVQPGDANASATASFKLPDFVPPLPLFGIVPHMHLLGKSIDVKLKKTDGSEQCLVNIPKWDFNWQNFYMYEQPVQFKGGDEAILTCTYDNSPENQPDGRTPQLVEWGDGTYDEMCLAYAIVQDPR